MRAFQWTLHSHNRDLENVKQVSLLMSKSLRHGKWSEADVHEGRARRRSSISLDEQGWVPFNELATLVADFLKRKRREEDGHGESSLVLQSKRYHRLLTALFGDSRDKVRFELLIEVEGVVFWDIAAARATQGHSIKVASQTTDLVMSPKTRETLTHACHVTKAENLKSIVGEGLKPGHEVLLEGEGTTSMCHRSLQATSVPGKSLAKGRATRALGNKRSRWSSSA
jgi:RNA:NAD 2'-phosphotransferase (TPT1/KptA family)